MYSLPSMFKRRTHSKTSSKNGGREEEKEEMEGIEGENSAIANKYVLEPKPLKNEDILICIDVDPESLVELKSSGSNGRPLTRLDSIKQAIILFVNAKLTINPDHRFAFATLAKSASWLKKEFSNDVESAIAAMRGLSASHSSGQPDLTNLFKVAVHEAKKSNAQNRIFRVILIYCRSSVRPVHQYVIPSDKRCFTLDVMYLHDKPGPENCPQEVYDTLVDTLELVGEYEGYILESGQGLLRIIFRYMCILLAHPQQRGLQDDLDFPKSLTKKSPAPEPMASEDSVAGPSQ